MAFDPTIILLSFFIGIVSFYLSFDLIERIVDDLTTNKKVWIFIGTTSMGLGIWAIHHFGMLASNMLHSNESFISSLVGVILSIAIAYVVLHILCKHNKKDFHLIISGVLITFSVLALHFIAMDNMHNLMLNTQVVFYWVIALITSVFFSYLSFKLIKVSEGVHSIFHMKKLLSATILGIVVSSLHLFTMIFPFKTHEKVDIHLEEHFHEPILIGSIVLFSVIIITPTIFVAHFDRKTMQKLAYYDFLTDIPNRRYAERYLTRLINDSKSKEIVNAILFIDCDKLKVVNDTYGHEVGDRLLKVFTSRVNNKITSKDLFARMGGDEFILVICNVTRREVEQLAQTIINDMQIPFRFNDIEISFSTSIGIKLFNGYEKDKENVIKHADKALYMAKEAGRNNYQFYNQQVKEVTREYLLSNEIKDGLKRNEFYVQYQPQVNVKEETITSFEALLRWEHAVYGNVTPNEFIPIAEKNGDILELTKFVLNEACETITHLQDEYNDTNIKIAVNISTVLIKNHNLKDILVKTLKEKNTSPSSLVLEITESVFIEDKEKVVEILKELQELGTFIAIDDFGTGFSSLSYIKELPINILKIDRQFIKNALVDNKVIELNKLIVKLGHTFHLSVIAEGVETLEQLEIIRNNNCDGVQGYFYGKPSTVYEIKRMLNQERLKNEA
jgi:diguanylate cyclase